MTPRQLNERIRQGEIWYTTGTAQANGIVKKAKSVKGKVVIITDAGSFQISSVRQSGANEWTPLTAEGPMTWAIN